MLVRATLGRRFGILCLSAFTVTCLGYRLTGASDKRDELLAQALAYWQLGHGGKGAVHPLAQVGKIELGVDAEGKESTSGGKVARLTAAYFDAGTSLNVEGDQVTVYLRARDPRGVWNYGLFSKRGGHNYINFNLFSVKLPSEPGPIIGFEVNTSNGIVAATFPASEIDPTAWHDFVGRYDGHKIELICDGRVMARRWWKGGKLTQNEEPVLIGAETDAGRVVRPFTGEIEEAALWSRSLGDAEVATLTRKDKVTAKPELRVEPYVHYNSPIHYRPERGILADTIPFYWKGEYHIFYLLAGSGGTPWAHIVSKDLIHWKELPIALRPGERDEPDGESAFTGSVIERNGTFHIFYTGWNPRLKIREQVMHATSPDLITWTKHPEDTFTADGVHYPLTNGPDFRDPFVFWNKEKRAYWMLVCARDIKTGAPVIGVAVSPDLEKWEQIAPLTTGQVARPPIVHDAMECPDLFRIKDAWYLIFSPSQILSSTAYRYTKNLAGPWLDPQPAAIDTPILYAAKRMFDGKRHILHGWVRDLDGDEDGGSFRWGGTLSIPREVYAGPAGQMLFRPIAEVNAVFTRATLDLASKPTPNIRRGQWQYEGANLVGRAGDTGALTSFDVPANYMMKGRFQIGPRAVFSIGFRTQEQEDVGYYLVLRPEQQEAEIVGARFRYGRKIFLDVKRPVEIQAFVQGSIIECFINDAYAFTIRAYNFPEGKLSLTTVRGDVKVLNLAVKTHQLE